ncbi:MAG: hypothetical protein IJD01_05210 [Clostridia bacterium]|nr:hypothetical protein [Clostridia bacterium]
MFDLFRRKPDLTEIFQATDNLARKTCLIGMYLVCEQKNSLLNNSELTRTDAVIFAAFLNHLLIASDAKNKKISKEVIDRYLAFVFQILKEDGGCYEHGIPSLTIKEMVENRFCFYLKIFRSNSNLKAAITALVEEFEYIIKTDIIEQKYIPFTESSALPVLGYEKDISCQIDAKSFPAFVSRMLEQPLSELLQLIK